MIQLVKRKKLDVQKYDDCIKNSMQSNIFGYAWYLDIVSDNWSVFVLNDYEAVMPVPWRRKFFIKYTYQPLWTIQLGIYSKVIEDEDEFLIELFGEFKYVNLRMNFKNSFSMFEAYREEKQLQVLKLESSYQTTLANYKKDRKKDLKKTKKKNLSIEWNGLPESFITLYKRNVGKQVKKNKEADYLTLLKIIKLCVVKGKGNVMSVFDKDQKIVASGFFLEDKKKLILLASSANFKNVNNEANTFLIDAAIQKYYPDNLIFNFGGIYMKSSTSFFESFGSNKKMFFELRHNNLPKLLKIFKKK